MPTQLSDAAAATAAEATAVSRAAAARRAQAGLGTAIESLLDRAWARVDVGNLDATLPQLFELVRALVNKYGPASGALASRFYTDQRTAAGIRASFTAQHAPLPNLDQINANVGWATAPLRGEQPDLELAKKQLAGAVDSLVLGVGRRTIIQNSKRDRQATGWARVPEPGCCSFCALLASRGAVYKEDSVAFEAHDHCRCHAEPIFASAGYEPSAEIREWQAMYDQVRGGSASNVRRKFRRLYEGRAQQTQRELQPAHG